jgi:hypothetical protein
MGLAIDAGWNYMAYLGRAEVRQRARPEVKLVRV